MKKESKNYKAAHYCKFILQVMFILLIGNKTYAQCSSADLQAIEINYSAITSTCYGSGSTDISTIPPYNVATNTIIIGNKNFPGGAVSMTATSIIVFGKTFSTASEFNSSIYSSTTNIIFTDGANEIIKGTPPASITGTTFSFTVNVINSDGQILMGSDGITPASRSYFFTIVKDGFIVGDPHITTLDGVHYDFQAVGEFTALRDSTGSFEIQTRQTAVATNGPGADSYSSLPTCVSLNTAVAARVGTHRVTYEPNTNGNPDPSGMQLRVDGALTTIGEDGLDLGSGGRIKKSSAGPGVIEIYFPDGASLVVTPDWWTAYSVWYLNVNVYHTAATKGIMGIMAVNNTTPGTGATHIPAKTKSWLPALPDGSSVGPMPQSQHDRFVTLYHTFADAWRVTDQTSLFDYAPGTSTTTFTNKNWPVENGQSCIVAGETPKAPIGRAEAEQLAIGIVDPILKANAIYDVMLTGEPKFAQTYLLTQKIQISTTAIKVYASKDTTMLGESLTFTAIVARKFLAGTDILTGTVEFTVDGKKFGQVRLEANGRAILTTISLVPGQHQIAAKFIPDAGSTAFSSSSLNLTHTVIVASGITQILNHWWIWALLLVLLIILYLIFRKKKP